MPVVRTATEIYGLIQCTQEEFNALDGRKKLELFKKINAFIDKNTLNAGKCGPSGQEMIRAKAAYHNVQGLEQKKFIAAMTVMQKVFTYFDEVHDLRPGALIDTTAFIDAPRNHPSNNIVFSHNKNVTTVSPLSETWDFSPFGSRQSSPAFSPVSSRTSSRASSPSSSPVDLTNPVKIFMDDIRQRSSIAEIRKYLSRMVGVNVLGEKAQNILSENILSKTFSFVLTNSNFKKNIALLQPGESIRFAKKIHTALPRTIIVKRTKQGRIELSLLSQSKLASGNKNKKIKKGGTFKKVSPEWHLNQLPDQMSVYATKKERLGKSVIEQESELARIKRENEMLNRSGVATFLGERFEGSDKEWAVRTTEILAQGELAALNKLLKNDKNYRSNDQGTHDKIFMRLIEEMLTDMERIHKAGILHNDIKGENILLDLDQDGLLHARISDFGISTYVEEQLSYEEIDAKIQSQRLDIRSRLKNGLISEQDAQDELYRYRYNLYSKAQPVATCSYGSPQMVGFYSARSKLNEYHAYSTLDNDICEFPSLGYELYQQDKANYKEDKDLYNAYHNLNGDQRNDIFSLGITIFMMLTDHYPTYSKNRLNAPAFSHYRYLNIDDAFKNGKYPALTKIEPLLRKMLAKDTNDRATATEAKEAFQKIMDGKTPGLSTRHGINNRS